MDDLELPPPHDAAGERSANAQALEWLAREFLSDQDDDITIGSQRLVRCQESQRFGNRLGDEHPVERVTMISERQTA